MSSGPEPITTMTGLLAFASTNELGRQNTEPGPASQTLAAERDGFVAAEGAGVLILESLEHAEDRNADILAEIEVYETSSDAILMQLAENDDDAYRLMVTEPKDEDPTSVAAPNSSG